MTKDLIKAQNSAPLHHNSVNNGQGFSRREFFKLTGLGLSGFFFTRLASPLEVLAQTPAISLLNTARYCIFIHLEGGPSHVDTFDLKEGSWTPADFQPTSYGQVRWPKGLMPRLAEQLPRIGLVRSMSAWALVHPLAQQWTQIGRNPASGLSKVAPNIGAVVALEYESRRAENQKLPGFIALNSGNVVGRGYLEPRYAPFNVQTTPAGLAGAAHPEGEERFKRRYEALESFDKELRREGPLGTGPDEMATSYDQARGLMYNPDIQPVFQYSTDELARFGNNAFGAACLVARNIIKADLGTRFIQINQGGWDHHSNIYDRNQGIYPRTTQLDTGLAQLITELAALPSRNGSGKTLLDDTLIVAMGEFGRTVGALTGQRGRDHYLQMSALLAGGGVRGGRVIGATDASGARTADPGWSRGVDIRPEDIFSTIYSAMGIDYTTIRTDDPFKRGFEYVPYAKEGLYAPVEELFS
ncbi:MAG: DUF1501 domain-containing protein [Acidobacteriota bacterium]